MAWSVVVNSETARVVGRTVLGNVPMLRWSGHADRAPGADNGVSASSRAGSPARRPRWTSR